MDKTTANETRALPRDLPSQTELEGLRGWNHRRTAFLVIHGIGDQAPLETLDAFGRTLAEVLADIPGARIEVAPYAGGGCEPHHVDASSQIVHALTSAWDEVAEEPARVGGFYGGTDARFFAKAGTQAEVKGDY